MQAAPRAPRHAALALLTVAALAVLSSCATAATDDATPARTPPTASPGAARTAVPSPRPTRTPPPTPTYTNVPDPELSAVIPETIGGSPVVKPERFALTPGDVGDVYGTVGDRFRSLAIGYTEEPRLTVFAMRMDPPRIKTPRLRAYLAEIGRYLGVAELDRDAWQLTTIGDKEVWMRGDDEATLPGTRIYTWVADDLVFLVIGTDEAHNTAALAALPGGE